MAGRLAVLAFALLFSAWARGAELSQETVAAWQAHVSGVKTSLDQCAHGQGALLLVDREQPLKDRVRNGRIYITHTYESGMLHVPNGLIHDWTGVVFLRGARLSDVTRTLEDYNSYAAAYAPAVTASQLLNRDRDTFSYRLKFQAKNFGIKAGLIGEFRSEYWFPDAAHGYSITEATRLDELADAGTPQERPLSAEEAHGYVERMFTVVRYSERDGGVYVEVQAITLSRDIPAAVRWMIAPFVEHVSRDVLTSTLTKFRSRVEANVTGEQAQRGLP